ncbi:hypothetical protein SBADM41S_06802 [Streptomyces badius]
MLEYGPRQPGSSTAEDAVPRPGGRLGVSKLAARNVVLHEERLEADNVMDIFSQYDLIVDGTDNFATRYLVNDAACC